MRACGILTFLAVLRNDRFVEPDLIDPDHSLSLGSLGRYSYSSLTSFARADSPCSNKRLIMKQFWKGVISVALAMALAYGWTWTGVLKDLHWIDDEGRVKILVAITVVFFSQQVWLVLPRPVARESVDARRPIVSNYLDKLLADYYRTLQSLHPNAVLPVVRINVMFPTRGLLGSFLKIYYYACPQGVTYSDREKALHWKKGQGQCGWAWKHLEITLYDSNDPDHQMLARRLTSEQKAALSSIKSVLSLPIQEKGKVVGVLSLDGKHDITETLFTDSAIVSLAESYSKNLSPLCFSDGVKA